MRAGRLPDGASAFASCSVANSIYSGHFFNSSIYVQNCYVNIPRAVNAAVQWDAGDLVTFKLRATNFNGDVTDATNTFTIQDATTACAGSNCANKIGRHTWNIGQQINRADGGGYTGAFLGVYVSAVTDGAPAGADQIYTVDCEVRM